MANISHFTQTVNGVSTTYDIHDEGAVPRSGGAVLTGNSFSRTVNNDQLRLDGGTNYTNGASVALYGKDYNGGLAGNVFITAYGNSDYSNFRIYPNGAMNVYNNSTNTTKNVAMQEDVVPRSGGTILTGTDFERSDDTSYLLIGGGNGWGKGARILTYGAQYSARAGWVLLQSISSIKTVKNMYLKPDGTWTWDGTACQITSDQRFKQQISNIDDKLLDAWESVELCQFKYNDAVDQKKDKARLHTGYVVQQIDKACKEHGVDVSQYGLYCHEEYPEETEEVEVEQADGTKTKERKVIREASEHYSLRYTEALIVECAYLRKCIKELRNEIEELKSSK